jgi:hypothetical protein
MEPGLIEAIGHLTFLWNDAEEALDRAVSHAFECPPEMQVTIRSRINGLDGKVGIIESAIADKELYPKTETPLILETLRALAFYKQSRDALIHARASEIHNGIARTFENKGVVYEVLLTLSGVNLLNEHLDIYRQEMDCIGGLLSMARAIRPPGIRPKTYVHKPPQQFAEAYQAYAKKLSTLQAQRKSLMPLPVIQGSLHSSQGSVSHNLP